MTDVRKPKVLLTHLSISEAGLKILREKCEIIVCEDSPIPKREVILSKSEGFDGILWATPDRLDAEALDRAGPQLKVISTISAGIDCVDVSEVKRRGIPLGHTPNVICDAVADLAIGLMISAARRFHEGYIKTLNANCNFGNPQCLLGQDIKGSTIGIVGFGGIGQKIAKRLKGFDVESILYYGRTEKPEGNKIGASLVSFGDLLRQSDFIFVACPLTDETKHMFNKAAFEKMKRNSVFINVARGGVVVQNDLIDALKNGTIFAAGLDVMTPEPLSPNDELTKLPNCVLMPHRGAATRKTRDDVAIVSAQNIINGIEGKPLIYSAY